MRAADVRFVNLGIAVEHLRSGFDVFGFRIAFYGIIIGIGMLAGIWVATRDALRRGQDPEIYTDYALYMIIAAIVGARAYYVLFRWEQYRGDWLQVFNLRGGGLAIYGGVIGALIALFAYTKVKRLSFLSMADSGVLGLLTGQIIGRWGNFFNCEVFGGYTDNLLAMQIRRDLVDPSVVSDDLLAHLVYDGGVEYIQVHPTFLYESLWNLAVLLFLLWYRKRKRFDGEMLCLYLLCYGVGRFWIEGIRTDQLILFGTGVAVSQALSALMVVAAVGWLAFGKEKGKNGREGEPEAGNRESEGKTEP
jgi:phosphatidylglycerol:prolipoprotein diacylglycerol transferase